ncbi:MAG: membrane dipeptidase [Pseudomonadota bacterium]
MAKLSTGGIVIDGLIPWSKGFLPAGANLGAVLTNFADAGVHHVSLTTASGFDDTRAALERIGFVHAELRAAGVPIANTASAIRTHHAKGQLSAGIHFQSATPYFPNLDTVETFAALGVRRAILAYNRANVFADGCHEPRNAGLSDLGKALCRRMDAAGVRVDLSHCGERTAFDALELGLTNPPFASHSNARALFDHERNISDDLIKAIAAAGGTVGINGVGIFLSEGALDLPAAMAHHAAHIADLIGEDNLTLGSDYMFLDGSDFGFYYANAATFPKGYPPPPWQFAGAAELAALPAALSAVGFSTHGIRGLMGETYLARVAPG